MKFLQDGIYYRSETRPGECMGIVFLRIDRQAKAEEVGQEIEKLWQTYKRLQNGRIRDVNLEYPDLFKDLTVLMAYGPCVFELRNAVRKKPNLFSDEWSFIPPRRGGCSIVEGSNLMHSEDLIDNHAPLMIS